MEMAAEKKTVADCELDPGVFVFPGLWEGKMRGMKVAEEDMLLNRRNHKKGNVINQLIKQCMLGEHDPEKMLIGDRVFALIQLRRLTHGDEYSFHTSCQHCDHQFEWEENLGDLKVNFLFESEQLDAEYTFDCVLPRSNKKIKWRMLRGKDEKYLEDIRRNYPDELSSYQMLTRSVEVDGEKMLKPSFFKELSASDAAFFRGEFEYFECGVDTKINIECPDCLRVSQIDLPIGPDFFMPTIRTRRRR